MTGRHLLSEYIEQNKLTQEGFARLAGVGQDIVSRLVSGKRGAGLLVAARIEKATGGKVPATAWLQKRKSKAPLRKAS